MVWADKDGRRKEISEKREDGKKMKEGDGGVEGKGTGGVGE